MNNLDELKAALAKSKDASGVQLEQPKPQTEDTRAESAPGRNSEDDMMPANAEPTVLQEEVPPEELQEDPEEESNPTSEEYHEYNRDSADPKRRIYTPEEMERRKELHERRIEDRSRDMIDLMSDPDGDCDMQGLGAIVFPEELEPKSVPILEMELDLSIIKTAMNAIETLVEEATFEADGQGLHFRAMDPPHVSLIDLVIPPAACKRYLIDGTRKFSLRVEDFQKDLRQAEKYDSVTLIVKASEMILVLDGTTRKEFEEPLLESDVSNTPLPKLTFDAMLGISKEEFTKILKNIGAKSNHLGIDTKSPNSVVFSGKGDAGNARVEVDKEMLVMHQIRTGSKATYSIEYLQRIMKAVKCTSISLEYSDKMPLKMTMQIGATTDAWMEYYLAPRVTE